MACSFAFLYFVYSFGAKKVTDSSLNHVKSNECKKKSSENGTCSHQAAESAEIIIVGAGVAGAALAYTLGKVQGFYSCIFLSLFVSSASGLLLCYIWISLRRLVPSSKIMLTYKKKLQDDERKPE